MRKLLIRMRQLATDIRVRLDEVILSQEHRERKCHFVEDRKDLQEHFDVIGSQLLQSALKISAYYGINIPV